MKKGETAFIVFASIWLAVLFSAALIAPAYPLVLRIVTILIATFPLGLYFIIKAVERSDVRRSRGVMYNNSKNDNRSSTPNSTSYQSTQLKTISNQNDIRILQECQNIMGTTHDLDTFFARYEFSSRIVAKMPDTKYKSDCIEYARLVKKVSYKNLFKMSLKLFLNLKLQKRI